MHDNKTKETSNMHHTRVEFNEINKDFNSLMKEYESFQEEYMNYMYSSIINDEVPFEYDILVKGIELIARIELNVNKLIDLADDPEVEFKPGERNTFIKNITTILIYLENNRTNLNYTLDLVKLYETASKIGE